MDKQDRNEVVPLPAGIAFWFQRVTGIPNAWGAIQKLQKTIDTAERETTSYAEAKLERTVQHINTSVRLTPGILDYALKHADIDDKGNVFVILIENNYTEEQLNADVDHLHYNITMTGAPSHIIHDGKKIAVDKREMFYQTIEPLSAQRFDPNNISPTMAVAYKTTKLQIERFGVSIEATDLHMSVADLVERFGWEMHKAIQTERTHKVIEVT